MGPNSSRIQESGIDETLVKIFGSRGFDIRDYKMSELQHRISRRMDVLDVSSLADYHEYLQSNSDEYEALLNTILGNVTQFFRDPEAWGFLRENVLPRILERNDEIRIWSSGCASGEEPYSVAIMLAEILGEALGKFVLNIYATDIDEANLKFARNGTYTSDQLAGVTENVRQKYFQRRGDAYAINREIRNLVIFSRHNLVSDPPMSRIDLLLCRNVLIYLNQALRSRIVPKLQYALKDGGTLWLGKAEILPTNICLLRPMNTKWRILKKTSSISSVEQNSGSSPDARKTADSLSANERFDQVIQNMRIAIIVLDEDLKVSVCNQAVRGFYSSLPEQTMGKSFSDLEISYRPLDLESRVQKVIATGESLAIDDVEYWISKDRKLSLKMDIIPVASGAMILMEDTTAQYEIRKELQITNVSLEAVNGKLLSTNEGLENGNGKLQSINAELQSTNEELESTNEELKATSEDLRARLADLSEQCHYYEILLDTIDPGIIVLDDNLVVRTWNAAAVDMCGGSEDDCIGKSLTNLNVGLPLERLADKSREVMSTGIATVDTVECIDHSGEKINMQISISSLRDGKSEGLVMMMKKNNEGI